MPRRGSGVAHQGALVHVDAHDVAVPSATPLDELLALHAETAAEVRRAAHAERLAAEASGVFAARAGYARKRTLPDPSCEICCSLFVVRLCRLSVSCIACGFTLLRCLIYIFLKASYCTRTRAVKTLPRILRHLLWRSEPALKSWPSRCFVRVGLDKGNW